MTKRTARALLASQRTIYRAMDILERERAKLEDLGASDLGDDIGRAISHLSQTVEEGLGHHIDDAESAIAKATSFNCASDRKDDGRLSARNRKETA